MGVGTMKDISLKAIILGFLIDLAVSQVIGLALGSVVGVIIGISLARSGGFTSPNAFSGAFAQIFTTSPLFLLATLLGGLLANLAGGYAAAAFAPRGKFLNATICGVISLFLGLLFMGGYSMWYSVVNLALVIPATHLGAWIRIRTSPALAQAPVTEARYGAPPISQP